MNSVANASTDLSKCGLVATAFLKAGGPDMGKEFSSLGGLKCGDVKGTINTGHLKCQVLLHVGIRPWDGGRTYTV